MAEDWTQQRILITGAARRLGQHLAEALVARGATVALHYHRSASEANRLAGRLSDAGHRCHLFQADLANDDDVDRLIRNVGKRCGPLTGLVNNASVYNRTPLADLDRETWQAAQQVNARAPIWLAAHLGRAMKKAGGGSIVNIGDWSIVKPYRDYLAYTVSKGALTIASRALARELAPEVRVNVVAPGPMLLPEHAPLDLAAKIRRAVPLGRLGGPEPFAQAVLFFLSNASSYCTGTVLTVDGGRSLA